MYDHLMKPALRNSLVAAGVTVLLGGALALEGVPEMLVLLSGALLIGGGVQLYVVHRRHLRGPVSDYQTELMDALTRVHTIIHTATDINLAQSLAGILASIDQIGSRVLRNHACVLYDTTEEFKVLHSRGVSSELSESMKESYAQRSGLFQLARYDVIPVSECIHDKRLKVMRARLEAERLRSLLFVPLLSEGRALGFAILFYNRPHSFSAEDIVVATAFGALVAAVIRNATLRHELERANQQFRTWADSSGEVLWIVDPALQCQLLNRRAEELIGQQRAGWLGRPLVEFVARSDREHFFEKAKATMSGRAQAFDLELGAGERTVKLSFRTSALYGDGGVVGAIGVGREQLDRRDDTAAPATLHGAYGFEPLATGMAHLFGNSISSILGRVSLLRAALEEQSPEARHVGAIGRSAQSINRLVECLLGYAYRYPKTGETFDLNPLTRETVSLVEHGLDPAVEVRVDLNAETLPMGGDPADVRHVLALLLQNALEAVGESGTIWVRTLRGALDEKLARTLGMNPGRCIVLGIRDTGAWPDLEAMERILVSSHEPGGEDGKPCRRVSAAQAVVRRLGGAMRISSVQGQGATFSVYLPLDPRGLVQDQPTEPVPVSAEGSRNATVLVVNEDPDMLDMICSALTDAGYAAIPVANASDAPGIIDPDPREIDAVIVDLGGPRSGGLHLVQRLMSQPYHPPLIVLRDCSHDIRALMKTGAGMAAVLRKPFLLAELLRELHDVLCRPAPTGSPDDRAT